LKKKSAAAALGSATMAEETVRANGDDVGLSTGDDELGFPGRSRSDAQKLSDTEDDEVSKEIPSRTLIMSACASIVDRDPA
jgi:hypothetical protein